MVAFLLPFLAATAVTKPSPAIVRPAPLAVATGKVLDADSNEPLAGALVQQTGSVTSVFTQADGTYRLLLVRNGPTTLTVSMTGYEDQMAPTGKDVVVRMREIAGFLPSSP